MKNVPRMETYGIRLPNETLKRLPVAAARHGMKSTEFVRMVLAVATKNDLNFKIDVMEDRRNERPTPAAD